MSKSIEELEKENAFLGAQLAGAVTHLRIAEGHVQQLTGQMQGYDARVSKIYRDKRDQDEKRNKEIRLSVAQLAQDAARYSYLRQHQVQIWKLGIAAQETELDKRLDAAMQSRETIDGGAEKL